MFNPQELEAITEGLDFESLGSLAPIEELSDKTLEESEIKCVASKFAEYPILRDSLQGVEALIHASQLHKMMTGNFGLSQSEKDLLEEYEERENCMFLSSTGKPLGMSPKMEEIKKELIAKRDNPDIGQTGKSYIDEIITSNWYGVPKYMYSKYTAHGNANEQFSIDMLNRYLGTNFEKNTETRTDLGWLLIGTPDIYSKRHEAIIDIKNPYDPYTFDQNRVLEMTETKTSWKWLGDMQREYFWQGQAYMHLFDVENFYLFFTLNENYYMENQNEYEKFGFLDRVIVKHCKRNREAMALYKDRLPAIRNAIIDAKTKRMKSIIQTERHLSKFKNAS